MRAAVNPATTRLVYIETPANPLWAISDIAAIAEIAHAAGAMLAVDSTVATPVFTRPLALGADIVMHSATKYMNGHTDRYRAYVCHAGCYDWVSMMATDGYQFFAKELGAFHWDDPARVMRQSPHHYVKKARTAVDTGDAQAADLISQAASVIDKTAERGIIHKNAAARRKSRLMKKAHKAQSASAQSVQA